MPASTGEPTVALRTYRRLGCVPDSEHEKAPRPSKQKARSAGTRLSHRNDLDHLVTLELSTATKAKRESWPVTAATCCRQKRDHRGRAVAWNPYLDGTGLGVEGRFRAPGEGRGAVSR
jgi:hypothetical protein